jgi:hypothetical protein
MLDSYNHDSTANATSTTQKKRSKLTSKELRNALRAQAQVLELTRSHERIDILSKVAQYLAKKVSPQTTLESVILNDVSFDEFYCGSDAQRQSVLLDMRRDIIAKQRHKKQKAKNESAKPQ